ncbi:MAG: glycosyltransferase family 4 protein [Phycisphaerae bacterium]|nr:glycosyltransferase family 4 protein [Phycisphaerae bacterium]
MKVLFLTKYNLEKFGIAEPLIALSAALSACGADVLIAGSHETAKAGRLRGGRPCLHAPLPKPGLMRGAAVRNLVGLCRQHEIEIIHCHGLYRPGYAARLIKRRSGIPYVVTSWGDIVPSSSRQQRRSVRRRCRRILADADAVTHPTAVIAEYAGRLCDVSAKSSIIPNGIDLSWWRSGAVPLAGRYILAIGKLTEQKGFGVLIDAMGRLAGRQTDISLVIAGSGQAASALRAQAGDLGLEVREGLAGLGDAQGGAVFFAGFVGDEMKLGLFRGARLVAFSSQYGEAFPGVLLEAMVCGKAIVASDIPATRAIITPGENALLVAPADADAWAAAIGNLLGNNELRSSIERNNLQRAEQYDWPVIAGKFTEIYRRVLTRRRRQAAT